MTVKTPDSRKKTGKWKKTVYWLLLLLCAAVFAYSSFRLIRYYSTSHETKSSFDALREMKEPVQTTTDGDAAPSTEQSELQPAYNGKERFAALIAKNGDFAGWITIDGTGIDYPVMHTPDDPEYYLKHDFDKQYSDWGVPFLAGICDVQKPSDNLIIFGHHMKDGSMFSDLEQFESQEFTAQHPTIRFDTVSEAGAYQIAYVLLTQAYTGDDSEFAYYQASDFSDKASFDAFISKASALSLFDTGITPVYGDRLLTLSTCEYSQKDGRLVIIARKAE